MGKVTYLLRAVENGPEAMARVSPAVQATEPVVVRAGADTYCHIQLTHDGAPLCGAPLPAAIVNLELSEHSPSARVVAMTGAAMCPDCQRAWLDKDPIGAAAAVHLALTEGRGIVPQEILDLFALSSIEQGKEAAKLMSAPAFANLLTGGLPQSVIDQIEKRANSTPIGKAEEDAPFTKCIVLAPVVACLGGLATVGHVLGLINKSPDAVKIVRTEGKGKQLGKKYVRFEIAAPVIGPDGKHCEPGAKSSVALDDPGAPLSWITRWSKEQRILNLYEEHAIARQRHAEAARRVDVLFARLMQDNPGIRNDAAMPAREERIWLTMFRYIRGGNPQTLIYSSRVQEALHKTFGCGWDGLSKISLGECRASTVEVANLSTLEPAQMTRAEWAAWNLEQYRTSNNGRNPAHDSAWRPMTDEEALEFYSRSHIHFVRQAIEQGKPVPHQVLADYPELTQHKDVANVPRALFKQAAANVRSDLLATRTGGYPLTFGGKLWLCVGKDNPAALPACRRAKQSCETCEQPCMARSDSAPARVYMLRVVSSHEWQGETINRRLGEGESPVGLVIHGGSVAAPTWIVTGEEATWQPDDSLDRLDSIVEQEHAKRAAEVAIVGGHRILFIGVGNMYDAERLAAWVEKYQADADAVGYCPCGNFGILGQCHCEKSQVDRWLKREVEPRVEEADIVIEVRPVDAPDLRQGEADELVWQRALAARQRFSELDPRLDGQAFKLLRQAKRQMGLDKKAAERITRVAQSIALLAGSKEINAAHVAEAIQYWPKPKAGGALSIDPEQPSTQAQVVTPKPARKPALPDGVPPMVEVDMGRAVGWAKAEVIKADARFLHYRAGDKFGKVPLAGRDMVWRVPAQTQAGSL